MTGLVRSFSRRNMSSSKIHCCYIIFDTEFKEKHTQWITRLLESSSGGRWGQDSGGWVCRDKLLCSLTASWGSVPSGQGAWNNPWICTRGNIGEGGKVVCLPFPSLARFWRTGKVNQSFAEDSIISPGNKSFLWSLSSPYFCQHLSGLHLLNLLSG